MVTGNLGAQRESVGTLRALKPLSVTVWASFDELCTKLGVTLFSKRLAYSKSFAGPRPACGASQQQEQYSPFSTVPTLIDSFMIEPQPVLHHQCRQCSNTWICTRLVPTRRCPQLDLIFWSPQAMGERGIHPPASNPWDWANQRGHPCHSIRRSHLGPNFARAAFPFPTSTVGTTQH